MSTHASILSNSLIITTTSCEGAHYFKTTYLSNRRRCLSLVSFSLKKKSLTFNSDGI